MRKGIGLGPGHRVFYVFLPEGVDSCYFFILKWQRTEESLGIP